MRISRQLLDDVIAHARADAPNECCGMIASSNGEAVAVHRARNTAASPFRYEMDGMEQYRIQTAIEDAGLELGAIYHSHTRSAPEPSQTDINLAFYPEALYVIVGLKGPEPDVRAWRIVDGHGQRGDARGRRGRAAARGMNERLDPRVRPEFAKGRLVRVGWARNQAEAEMMEGLLLEQGIPSLVRRTGGADVPDFLAAGPREHPRPRHGRRARPRAARHAGADRARSGRARARRRG